MSKESEALRLVKVQGAPKKSVFLLFGLSVSSSLGAALHPTPMAARVRRGPSHGSQRNPWAVAVFFLFFLVAFAWARSCVPLYDFDLATVVAVRAEMTCAFCSD